MIKRFEEITSELKMDILDDTKWPVIFGQLMEGQTLDEQYISWFKLLKFFLEKERVIGHCHKGLIYWNLGVIDLVNGDIDKAINYLEKSMSEDKIKLKGEKRITASIGLLSIIKPLLHRFKSKKQKWQFDPNIKELYEILSKEEKYKYANMLLEAHNNFTLGKVRVIQDNFFSFITDDRTRDITKDTYKEVSHSVIMGAQNTYYSQIFSMGSIIDAMLDELFLRNSEEVWKIFRGNSEISRKIGKSSKLNKNKYPLNLTLGEKTWILREMALKGICPISKESLLFLLIIGEYRDLIHPRRRIAFEFDANIYVASILLVSISYVAGDWWPENIRKIIEANYRLNN